MKLSFRLFVRPGTPASDLALAALREYCARRPAEVEVIDIGADPGAAVAEPIIIVPTLVVRAGERRSFLVKDLAPLDVLQASLEKMRVPAATRLDLSNPELRELLRNRCELTQYLCLHHKILTTWAKVGHEDPYLLLGCDCQERAAVVKRLQDPNVWERFDP